MAGSKDVLDSQILSESVGFLENCFENSFTVLQSSLKAVKEYLSEEKLPVSLSKKADTLKKVNESILHKSTFSNNDKSISQSQREVYKTKENHKKLKDWGLPQEISNKYEARGITEMFDWQVTCLSNPKVLMECCNLVYSAPTSAGKTLVAEIITVKTILERQKKVIIILPFVSIVREKMFYLQDILSSSGVRVEGFMGSQSPPGGLHAVHVAICTIEKANSLINKMLDDGSISELGAVIVDELHLLGDPHRGYILELLLTKVKYVSMKLEDTHIQIVGMSATLPNLESLANWLEAELFITDYRPIPLDEYCLVGNKYYSKDGEYLNTVEDKSLTGDNDNVLKICLDTITENCSVLIFCMTKNRCENLALSVSSSFFKIGCSGSEMGIALRNQLKTDDISEVLEQLKNSPVGLDQVLKNTISFGVAYHHAGLTFDERDIIEGGFKTGAIRVLVATSTLSSGVNLPARKVIVRTPVFQRQPINILTYKQMIGRAGRMGKDTKGESILICTEAEKKIGFDLMMGALAPVKSCIESEDKFMRAVLEMIASQIVCTKDELELYAKCTLLFTEQRDVESDNNLIDKTLKELINYELVRIQTDGEEARYVATPLGKACLSSSMAPYDGLSLFCELQKARQCLVLENDLHLIYLVTPYSVSNQWGEIDWLHLLTLWESLTKAMKKVGELVGVQESFIIRSLRGGVKSDNSRHKLNIHKRFYTALALQDLVDEVPLSQVAAKFQCARGFLQSLQQAAATFAGMVTAFCNQLGWKNMGMLVSQFQDRLHFGVQSDLIELMKLPSLNGVRARSLFDNGFETITSIASGDVNRIENALHKAIPFQSEKVNEGDDNEDVKKRNKIKNVWITGCCAMTTKQAAENLILEARKYLEYEIGVCDIKWDKRNSKEVDNRSDSEITAACNNVDIVDSSNKENLNIGNANDMAVTNYTNTDPKVNLNQDKTIDVFTSSKKIKTADNLSVAKAFDVSISIDDDDKCVKFTSNVKCEDNYILDSDDNNKDKSLLKVTTRAGNCNSIGKPFKDITNVTKTSKETNEDIVWDSLNFTEIPIDCVTKLRGSDQIFSPNISFDGIENEIDKKEDCKTVSTFKSSKDVSLFSTDGDNSSLFEDSLPLDQLPSKLLDNFEDHIDKNHSQAKEESILNNTYNNGEKFKSNLIEIDEDEDIKLVYDEDIKITESNNDTGFDMTIDIEEINTQDVERVKISRCFVSPFKRHTNSSIEDNLMQPPKKAKTEDVCLTLNGLTQASLTPILKKASSKKRTIGVQNIKLDCFVLAQEDIIDNMHIFNHIDNASIYLDVRTSMSSTVIGSNILRSRNSTEIDINEHSLKNTSIKSITICYGSNTCITLDLTSLDKNRMKLVKNELCNLFSRKDIKWKYLSLQSLFVHIKCFLDIELPLPWVDMSLVEWMIDSDEKSRHLSYMAKKYCELDLSVISIWVDNKEKKFMNLESSEELFMKSWLIWEIAERLHKTLLTQYESIPDTIVNEAQVLKILSTCEYSGVAVDKQLASQLLIDVRQSQETLQRKAFKICGYHFNFNSSKDVAKVLGIYKGRKVSTKKSILTAHNTPMSSIIIFWRKLNSILTKTLYPLTEKACIYSEGDRINPSYTMYTSTGRVSMHEPNLQNVPRTFSIPLKYLSNEETSSEVVEFNCRNIFKAAPGYVLVSADYCQLEMRILTHYSEDSVLMGIMSSNVDVFKSIAATWSGVNEDEVDDDLRQKAKQLCYGILYGMGNKTLAQHLDVTELEAAVFMDSFYNTYPAIKKFTKAVVEDCRRCGYVETLTKRQRYLPDINSPLPAKRSAAERQAVNTTIQGSAADIAKAAMCAIDKKTDKHRYKPNLYLQMHDELIYEVHKNYKNDFLNILKNEMEKTVRLKVPLPVKVKSGPSWGALQEVEV